MQIELLDWDSDFFGAKIGRLVLNKDDDWNEANLKNFDLVYVFVEPSNKIHNSLLQSAGAFLADEKVTYLMDLGEANTERDDPNIELYFSSRNDDWVISIGVQSGIYSRFNIDPRIGKETFERLYTLWMKRSISREIAKEVFVYKVNDEIAGVITVGEKNRRADIGIIAVDENFRGQAIGKALLQETINYSINNGYSSLQVVTQRINRGACRFYERNGFTEESVYNIYHYWSQ